MTYRDITVDTTVTSAKDSVWQWLAHRQGRIDLLRVTLRLKIVDEEDMLECFSMLTSLSQLTALRLSSMPDLKKQDPWAPLAGLGSLKELSLRVSASGDPSPLSALTGLTSLNLDNYRQRISGDIFSFSSLQPLSTLQQLEVLKLGRDTCRATSLQGLAGLSRLTEVNVWCEKLESLKGLSAGVTSLHLDGTWSLHSLAGIEGGVLLQELELSCYRVTSLQPLATLSKLRVVSIRDFSGPVREVSSSSMELFQASSSSLQSLSFYDCGGLDFYDYGGLSSLQGVEKLTVLEALILSDCTTRMSLKPLSSLASGLTKLHIVGCSGVVEEFLELPHIQPTADVKVADSVVREMVLAGGVWRAAEGRNFFNKFR